MIFSSAKNIFLMLCLVVVGVIIGGYLFADTKPRSIIALHDCRGSCLRPNELIGLLGSVGIQKFPDFIPMVVQETDKTIVVKHPVPQAPLHYVVIPKKDIKNVGDMGEEDNIYLFDAYQVMASIIQANNLVKYKVYTNGPGYQTMGYLHFHLLSKIGEQ